MRVSAHGWSASLGGALRAIGGAVAALQDREVVGTGAGWRWEGGAP